MNQTDVDVLVMAVHGLSGQSTSLNLIKSGAIYGKRVQLFDPGISLLATLGNANIDIAALAAENNQEQNEYLAKVLIATKYIDVDLLVGLDSKGVVSLIDPLQKAEIGTGRAIDVFMKRFEALLNQPSSFLMLDRPAANVFKELRQDGNFAFSPGATRRSHEASTANGLLSNLPNFQASNLDDIIGIRETLGDALPRFHAGVAEISESFTSAPDELQTFDDIDAAWRSIVAPALQEIDELSRESKFLSALGKTALTDTKTLIGGGIGVITAFATPMDTLGQALTTAAGAAAGLVTSAHKSASDKSTQLKRHRFYLLHRANELLAK